MADTNETVADIIAEKRRRADEIERDCAEKMKRGEMVSDCYARELVADIRREADRLEAAHGREVDVLKQRCAELNAEVAAKDEVIKRLNDAISEEQRRKMATTEKSVGRRCPMKDRTKLKPCPFCGSEAYLEDVRIQSDDTMWFVIHCSGCAAMMDFMNDDILKNKDMAGNSVFDIEDFHEAVEEAIASWNERLTEGGAK